MKKSYSIRKYRTGYILTTASDLKIYFETKADAIKYAESAK